MEGVYLKCWGTTTEAFKATSPAALQFEQDLRNGDKNYRKRAAERAIRGPEPTPVPEGERPGTTEGDSDVGALSTELPKEMPGTTPTPDASPPAAESGAGPRQPEGKHVVGERLFRKTGDFWTLVFEGGGPVNVKTSKGMQYIAYLLQCPDKSLTCVQLVAAAMGRKNLPTLGSAGEVLDETAIEVYRRRREDLESQLSEAEYNGDQGRKESIQEEQEALNQQIGQAFGIGVRRRSLSNDAEKLRKGVSIAIKRAIATIRKHHPALAGHFERYIQCGFSVCYCSDGKDWQF